MFAVLLYEKWCVWLVVFFLIIILPKLHYFLFRITIALLFLNSCTLESEYYLYLQIQIQLSVQFLLLP